MCQDVMSEENVPRLIGARCLLTFKSMPLISLVICALLGKSVTAAVPRSRTLNSVLWVISMVPSER